MTTINEACDRLDAQQQEIERLKAENKRLDRWHDYFAWEREMKKVEAKNVRLTAEKKALIAEVDRVREERTDAKDEQIAELNADKVQLENDACVERGEIENLKLIVRGLQICNNLGPKKGTEFTRNFRHLLQTGNGAGSSTYEAVYESAEESCSIIERLTAEKKTQAERIEKLETFLTNLKDCASAGDITLIEQVLEGEEKP